MQRFDTCLDFILRRIEGAYSNDPADKGGPTLAGVTQATFDAYCTHMGLPRAPVLSCTPAQREAIYLSEFWRPVRAYQLPAPLDLVVFDAAINHGPAQAVRFLQRALGEEADGLMGPTTLAAVQHGLDDGEIPAVVKSVLGQREIFYGAIVARDPSQKRWLNGWLNRIKILRAEVAAK